MKANSELSSAHFEQHWEEWWLLINIIGGRHCALCQRQPAIDSQRGGGDECEGELGGIWLSRLLTLSSQYVWQGLRGSLLTTGPLDRCEVCHDATKGNPILLGAQISPPLLEMEIRRWDDNRSRCPPSTWIPITSSTYEVNCRPVLRLSVIPNNQTSKFILFNSKPVLILVTDPHYHRGTLVAPSSPPPPQHLRALSRVVTWGDTKKLRKNSERVKREKVQRTERIAFQFISILEMCGELFFLAAEGQMCRRRRRLAASYHRQRLPFILKLIHLNKFSSFDAVSTLFQVLFSMKALKTNNAEGKFIEHRLGGATTSSAIFLTVIFVSYCRISNTSSTVEMNAVRHAVEMKQPSYLKPADFQPRKTFDGGRYCVARRNTLLQKSLHLRLFSYTTVKGCRISRSSYRLPS